MAQKEGYLEAPEGSQVVAAAATVAAGCGGGTPITLPDDLAQWIRGKEASLKQLAPTALAAIQRVRKDDSELEELWCESDDYHGWCDDLEKISAALA